MIEFMNQSYSAEENIRMLLGNQQPGITLRQMVDGLTFIKLVRAEYAELGFRVPKPLDEEIESFTRRAKIKYQEELEMQLAAAKKKAEDLKTKEKQREDVEKEINDLTSLLGAK